MEYLSNLESNIEDVCSDCGYTGNVLMYLMNVSTKQKPKFSEAIKQEYMSIE